MSDGLVSATPMPVSDSGDVKAALGGSATVWLGSAGRRADTQISLPLGYEQPSDALLLPPSTEARITALIFADSISSYMLGTSAARLYGGSVSAEAAVIQLATPLGRGINVTQRLANTQIAQFPGAGVSIGSFELLLKQCYSRATSGCDLRGESTVRFSYARASSWGI